MDNDKRILEQKKVINSMSLTDQFAFQKFKDNLNSKNIKLEDLKIICIEMYLLNAYQKQIASTVVKSWSTTNLEQERDYRRHALELYHLTRKALNQDISVSSIEQYLITHFNH